MNAETAISILGMNACGVPFNNMIRALQMLPRLNTNEDTRRLEAALWVRRHRRAYEAECAKRRDKRSK